MAPQLQEVPKTADIRIDKTVALRQALAREIKKIEEEHKQILAEKKQTLEEADNFLLAWLENTGQEMARTKEGTIYKINNSTASCSDPDAFMDYVAETGNLNLLERRANKTACLDFAEQHGSLPPGVKVTFRRTLGVRKS